MFGPSGVSMVQSDHSACSERHELQIQLVHAKVRLVRVPKSSLVRNLTQWIRLIHKLGQLVRSKETIDHRTQRLRIDQIRWSKDLVVTNIHTLPNGSSHPSQTNTKLAVELLSNCSDPTIR